MPQAPQILQLLNRNPNIEQIRQVVAKFKSLNNPQAAMQQLLQQNNPQLAQALDYIKQHGGDPKAAFEQLAKERGINPADLGL